MSSCSLSAEPISVDQVLAAVVRPDAGAVVLFLGLVRDHNQGAPITLLEYDAYESMALKEMQSIADALEAEFAGVRVAAAHRTGSLKVGEIAVVCAVSAAHRGPAFAACSALIDRIKERVPIWKREHGPDGAYWINWIDARTKSPADGTP